jgi:hypothetical protein
MKKSASWILMFVLCLFMGTMMALSLPNQLKAEKVVAKNQLVPVAIVRSSASHWGKRPAYFLHFTYQGQAHSAKVSPEFLRQIEGLRSTQLLHLPEYPTIFLQPGHTESGEFLAGCLLVAMFLGLMIYSGGKILRAFRT